MYLPSSQWQARTRAQKATTPGMNPFDKRRHASYQRAVASTRHSQSTSLPTLDKPPAYADIDSASGAIDPPLYNGDELLEASIDYDWLYGPRSFAAAAGRASRRVFTSFVMAGIEPANPPRPPDGMLRITLTRQEFAWYALRDADGRYAGLAGESEARAWLRRRIGGPR